MNTFNYSELKQFSGSEHNYKGWLDTIWTDGVMWLTNHACWLVTDVSTIVKIEKNVKSEEFVSIVAEIKDSKVSVSYTDGNEKELFKQNYEYTDLPDGKIKFFFTNGVLMLVGEY